MKNFIRVWLMVLIIGLFLAGEVLAVTNIELILDCSNSMNAPIKDGKKIVLAKAALNKLIDTWPTAEAGAVNMGLRLYGHKFDAKKNNQQNCLFTELVVPISGLNKQLLKEKINSAAALGRTPIAYSLELAAADFKGKEGHENIIVLVSDGVESCGGDPSAAAKKLAASGLKVVTNVIGFDVSTEDAKNLKMIADAGGGKYYKARNAAELQASLEEASGREKKKFELSKMQGKNVDPGNNIENAPLISAGKYVGQIYAGEKLFYKIKLKKNQNWKVVVQIRQPEGKAPATYFSAECYLYNEFYKRDPYADGSVRLLKNDVVNFDAFTFESDRILRMEKADTADRYLALVARPANKNSGEVIVDYSLEITVK